MNIDKDQINPSLIRNYHFVRTADNQLKVQFIGIGDKHRMIKQDSGQILIIKEKEKGKPFRFGAPFSVEEAVKLLEEGHYTTHHMIAKHILETRPR